MRKTKRKHGLLYARVFLQVYRMVLFRVQFFTCKEIKGLNQPAVKRTLRNLCAGGYLKSVTKGNSGTHEVPVYTITGKALAGSARRHFDRLMEKLNQ